MVFIEKRRLSTFIGEIARADPQQSHPRSKVDVVQQRREGLDQTRATRLPTIGRNAARDGMKIGELHLQR